MDYNGAMDLIGFDVVDDSVVGAGGFLAIRRLRLRMIRADGSRTAEGLWDFVERPMGLDAVVLALWHRRSDGGVDVLLREGLRVPLHFGRPEKPKALHFAELVAGIVERGEESAPGLAARAAAEALEEAGLTVPAPRFSPLGPPAFPTPGMCAERFHFLACEVSAAERAAAVTPAGDGSPFEEGARLAWSDLTEALGACARGELADLKTELGLRRLREALR